MYKKQYLIHFLEEYGIKDRKIKSEAKRIGVDIFNKENAKLFKPYIKSIKSSNGYYKTAKDLQDYIYYDFNSNYENNGLQTFKCYDSFMDINYAIDDLKRELEKNIIPKMYSMVDLSNETETELTTIYNSLISGNNHQVCKDAYNDLLENTNALRIKDLYSSTSNNNMYEISFAFEFNNKLTKTRNRFEFSYNTTKYTFHQEENKKQIDENVDKTYFDSMFNEFWSVVLNLDGYKEHFPYNTLGIYDWHLNLKIGDEEYDYKDQDYIPKSVLNLMELYNKENSDSNTGYIINIPCCSDKYDLNHSKLPKGISFSFTQIEFLKSIMNIYEINRFIDNVPDNRFTNTNEAFNWILQNYSYYAPKYINTVL